MIANNLGTIGEVTHPASKAPGFSFIPVQGSESDTSPALSPLAAAAVAELDRRRAPHIAKYVALIATIAKDGEVDPGEVLDVCGSVGKSAATDLDADVETYREWQRHQAAIDPKKIDDAAKEDEAAMAAISAATEAKEKAKQALKEAEEAELVAIGNSSNANRRLSQLREAAMRSANSLKEPRFAIFNAAATEAAQGKGK